MNDRGIVEIAGMKANTAQTARRYVAKLAAMPELATDSSSTSRAS
jgi:hypothetical protein